MDCTAPLTGKNINASVGSGDRCQHIEESRNNQPLIHGVSEQGQNVRLQRCCVESIEVGNGFYVAADVIGRLEPAIRCWSPAEFLPASGLPTQLHTPAE